MSKLVWAVVPLGLYALWIGVAGLRRRMPSRSALNAQTSVLLALYLVGTAGLGIFWVAKQQLPVFDLHYLLGYVTLLVVVVHLAFNLPMLLRSLRGRRKRAGVAQTPGGLEGLGLLSLRTLAAWLLAGGAVAAAFR